MIMIIISAHNLLIVITTCTFVAHFTLMQFTAIKRPEKYNRFRTKKIQRKTVNISLPKMGAQKNPLVEMVLLSTHNICFG